MKRECKRRKYEGPERAELSRGPKKSASTSDGNVSAKGHILIPRTSFPFHFHSRMLALHCNGLLWEKGKRTRERVYRFLHPKKQKRREETVVQCTTVIFPSFPLPLCATETPHTLSLSLFFSFITIAVFIPPPFWPSSHLSPFVSNRFQTSRSNVVRN